MLALNTLTQTGLRLELVKLELHSLIDRSVKSEWLHEIIEYCVPRRLLRSVTIWGMRGTDGLMWLDIRLDYSEHDRQITLSGDTLPDGIAGSYTVGFSSNDTQESRKGRDPTCPHLAKALELFVETARARGFHFAYGISFTDQHDELRKKFGIGQSSGKSEFRDLTRGAQSSTVIHSVLPELRLVAAIADEMALPGDQPQQTTRQLEKDGIEHNACDADQIAF